MPPSPYQTVDTLKIARRHFAFTSNKLNDLAQFLGIGTKAQTGGLQLWLDCMAGVKKAWNVMRKYNKQDVVLLEQVYLKLRPWDNKHPNVAPHGSFACPKCTSTNVQKRGFDYTKAKVYQRYVCKDCGGWCRGTTTVSKLKRLMVNA